MKISIVVPAYHEEENIKKLLTDLSKKVKTQNEVLIVYDSEKDPTVAVVNEYIKNTKNKKIKLVRNSEGNRKGVTNAMKTGFKNVKGFAAVAVMADLSDNLSDIDKMVEKINSGADIVCGSRYMKGGRKIGGPILKTFLSKTAGLSLYYLFKLPTHDGTNAFKMYRKSLLDKIKIESTGGFEYSLEITLKAFKKGYQIVEIPTVWYDRPAGKSNFKILKWLPKYISTYLIVFKKTKLRNAFVKWKENISKISIEEHMIILLISFTLSIFFYFLALFTIDFNFSLPKTTAINWITINQYPKQQDYYFFYSFLTFNLAATLLLWFLWVSLKIKKQY